jgi:hypothetical protein
VITYAAPAVNPGGTVAFDDLREHPPHALRPQFAVWRVSLCTARPGVGWSHRVTYPAADTTMASSYAIAAS